MSDSSSPYEVSDSSVATGPLPLSNATAPPSQVAKVFGIIHLVYAVLGVFSAVGGVVSVFVIGKLSNIGGPEGKEIELIYKAMQGMMSYAYIDMVVKFLLGLLLFIAGIGLLKKKMWAAKMTIGWGVLRIVAAVAITIMMMGPTQRMNEQMANIPGGIASDSLQLQTQMAGVGNVVSIIMVVIYPVLCIIFLSKKSVKQSLR